MNIYDQTHELARALRQSEEYTSYAELRQRAFDDPTNKALLDEYKRLQYRMQLSLASGDRMSEDDYQRMQKIASLLQFNADASAYLLAEFRLQKLLGDMYKILADAAGIDLDMLSGH